MSNEVNYLLETETTQTPDCTSMIFTAYNDEPKVIDRNERTPADYSIKNRAAVMNRRRTGGVQATPYGVAAIFDTETTQTPDCTTQFILATVDDPISSGDFTIYGNLQGNRLANYIPRVAGG